MIQFKKGIAIVAFLLVCFYVTRAQDTIIIAKDLPRDTLVKNVIQGYVLNNQTGIEGATVVLMKFAGSTIASSVLTTKDGLYRFQNLVPGKYFISVSSSGMKKIQSLSFLLEEGKQLKIPTINMTVAVKELNEVVIEAPKNQIQIQAGKLVYNVDKNITASGKTAFEIIRAMPGVTVDADENINLKGGNTVNVMVDGKMTYLDGQQLTLWLKSLPAEGLAKIEVVTTPSSQYDAAGNAGILNIVTKRSVKRGYALNLTAGAGAGRYGQTNEGITGNIGTKKFTVFGSYNYSYNHSYLNRSSYRSISSNGQLINYDRHSFDPSIANNNNYKAGVDIYINKTNELGVVYNGASNLWQRDAEGPTYLRNAYGKVDSVVLNKNITTEPAHNNAINLNYKLRLDTSGKQLTMNADYATYRNNSTGSLGNGLFDNSGHALSAYQDLAFQQPSLITIRSLTIDAVLPFHAFDWKAGIKYAFITSDNDFVYDSLINGIYIHSAELSNHFIYDEHVYAAYSSVSRQLTKNLTFDAGLRIESTVSKGNSLTKAQITDRNYTDLFPYLSVTRQMNNSSSLTVSITRRINRPVYANLNPFRYFFDKYSYAEGNPYLQPERSWNGAMSWSFKKGAIITINYSRTENAMLGFALQDSLTGIFRVTTYNFSHKNNADLLAVLPIKIAAWWDMQNTIDLSYTSYSLMQDKTVFHPSRLSADIQTQHNFTLKHTINAEINIQYTSPALGGIYILRPYFQVDCAIRKTFFKSHLDVKLALADVFKTDRYWAYSVYSATSIQYDHRPDSRRIRLAVGYHIGGKLSAGKSHKLEEQERL